MLQKIISNFLKYCKLYNFSTRSIEVFTSRLNEFSRYIDSYCIKAITDIEYEYLLSFVLSGTPSVYTRKSKVWVLHQFFHYLVTNKIIKKNIALKLPYPKIGKKEPEFLSFEQLKTILNYFISFAVTYTGLRNLIIVLFFVFLGLRISSVVNINIQDIDLKTSSILISEKGSQRRIMPLPQILCFFLYPFLESHDNDLGPLFLSRQNKRISTRMVHQLFVAASDALDMHIYSHLFRHTAATQINKIAGLDVTKQLLGHSRRESSERYVHLNPDIYVEYMARHPYMTFQDKEDNNE